MSLRHGPQDEGKHFSASHAPGNAKMKPWNRYFPLFFSLLYASVLAALPVEEFIDRSSYLSYAVDSYIIYLGYLNKNPLSIPFNEPLWLIINITLSYFLDMRNVVRSIIFVSSFSISITLLTKFRKDYIWIIFILVFPQVLKNYVIHLRQGAAISVFIVGYYARYPLKRWILTGASPLMHSSFFFVTIMLYFNTLIRALKINIYIRVLLFILFYLSLVYGINFAAQQLGARQAAALENDVTSATGVAFVFWLFILSIFLLEGAKFLKDNVFQVSSVIFYLVAYLFTSYAGRIFESGLVLVMVAMTELKGWRKQAAMTMMIIFALYVYASNIDKPGLGWGL